MKGRITLVLTLLTLSIAHGAEEKMDPKQLELSEALSRHGFTDETLSEQSKMVALGVAECSAKHLLCEGDRCLTQLDSCISVAASHSKSSGQRAISSLERPKLRTQPKTTR